MSIDVRKAACGVFTRMRQKTDASTTKKLTVGMLQITLG